MILPLRATPLGEYPSVSPTLLLKLIFCQVNATGEELLASIQVVSHVIKANFCQVTFLLSSDVLSIDFQ